jgi:hypothetical protein
MRFGLKSLLFFVAAKAAIIWWSIHWPVHPAPVMISYRFDFDSRPPIAHEIIVRIALGTIGSIISWVADTYIVQRLRRAIT